MADTTPVRFAIVSPARWGRLLLDAAAESGLLTFVGVFSRSADNAAQIVDKYGGVAYESYDALLADATVEAVLLPTPHFLHHPQAVAAMNAGKHVFVEKPMANSLAEATEMQRLSEARGLVLAVGQQGRRTGGLRKAKELLNSGALGEIALAVAQHGAPIAQQYSADDWETDPNKSPGGPLDNLGVHYIDIMHYLFGPASRVSGFYTKRLTPFAVPDAGIANIEFANGVIGVYTTHQVSTYASQLTLYGTKASLHIRRFGQELELEPVIDTRAAQANGPQREMLTVDGPLPYTTALQEELEDFARCIRQGGTPEVGAREGIQALRIIRAVLEASDSGRYVDVSQSVEARE